MNLLDQALDHFEAQLPNNRLTFTPAQAFGLKASRLSFHEAAEISRKGRKLQLGGVAVNVHYDKDLNEGPVVVSTPDGTASISENSIILKRPDNEMVTSPTERATLMSLINQALDGAVAAA